MNNLEEDVNILSRLLEENRDSIRTKLLKYAAEDQHMRMQLMLRDYFKEEKALLKPHIEEEARSIAIIFPDTPIGIIQDMLVEISDQTDRSKIVIKKLCSKKANGLCTKRSSPNNLSDKLPKKLRMRIDAIVDDNENEIVNRNTVVGEVFDCDKIEMEEEPQSGFNLNDMEAQPSTSHFMQPVPYVDTEPTFDRDLFDRTLEVFPDACPKFLQSLCEKKDLTEINLVEIVHSLLEGDYPKRL